MKKLFSLLAVLMIVSGCARMDTYRNPEFLPSNMGKVAIVPFTTLAGEPGGGQVMARMVENELRRQGSIEVMPQGEVSSRLVEVEGELLPPAEVSKLLEADTLITGQVNEYRYKQGVEEEPVISLTVQVADGKTGAILYSNSLSRVGRMSWLHEDSLGRLAQQAAQELVQNMLEEKQSDG